MSSVSEINCKVQEIVYDAKPYMSRINVQYACSDLLAANDMLHDYFQTDGYSTSKLDNLKKIVSTNYVRLEYIISEFEKKYESQYLKRIRIKKANENLLSIAKDKQMSTEVRSEALGYLHFITSACLRIDDIDIILDDGLLCDVETFVGEHDLSVQYN